MANLYLLYGYTMQLDLRLYVVKSSMYFKHAHAWAFYGWFGMRAMLETAQLKIRPGGLGSAAPPRPLPSLRRWMRNFFDSIGRGQGAVQRAPGADSAGANSLFGALANSFSTFGGYMAN